MKKELKTDFEPTNVEYILNGVAYSFAFDNGYGASVICHDGSYGGKAGLWELAVLKKDEDGEYDLCYDTGITNDVIGHLQDAEVDNILKLISQLQ